MKVLVLVSVVVALVAGVLILRVGVFEVDATRTELSLQPDDTWRRQHSCVSAYAEAARFAADGDRNIYDRKHYADRFIEGLKVDPYHYPPPFLLLPGAIQGAAGGYLQMRPFWYAMQLGLLVAVMLAIVRFLGKRDGKAVLLAAPLMFIAPTTLFTLQMGNFQGSAVALALLGMIGLASSRVSTQAAGGLALAFATLAKVFPGVLGVILLVTRRWRAAIYVALAGAVLTLLALAVYGTQPFHDFISYELPRLSSGEAFPQSERPNVVAVNWSFYGMLVKLRALGIGVLDQRVGLRLSSLYGLVLLGVAAAIAWRRRAVLAALDDRVMTLQVWLALVNLASFRSPFVGGGYGVIGTVLLATIGIATAPTLRSRIAWGVAYVVLAVTAVIIPTPGTIPSTDWVVVALVVQVFVFVLNAVPLVRIWRCPVSPSAAPFGRDAGRDA